MTRKPIRADPSLPLSRSITSTPRRSTNSSRYPVTAGNGRFDLPSFSVRFIALDLEHNSDFGTTWQTCHAFAPGSAQFEWYKKTMAESKQDFVFTINNEQNSNMRRQAAGEWGKMFRTGSALITGFGSFNERAEWDGFPALIPTPMPMALFIEIPTPPFSPQRAATSFSLSSTVKTR